MKKIVLIVAVCAAVMSSYAQNINDALRYGETNVTGTARFSGMSGAFGALGGDLSAVGINPASSAVFIGSTYSFTFSNDQVDNDVTYFGNTTNRDDGNLSFNQGGAAFVYDINSNSPWKKFTFAVNYDRTNSLRDSFTAQGTGDTSIASYFSNFAQGIPLDLLETVDGETVGELYQFLGETEGFGAQQALLGFQAFILDPVNSGDFTNTQYTSAIAGNEFAQSYSLASTGYNGKLSFNGAGQYGENTYVGLNINSHFFDYDQSTVLRESNTNSASSVQDVRFENNLRSTGAGISFQLGAIHKINNLRLGFTYDSPTWLTIAEEGSQRIDVNRTEGTSALTTTVNPRIINIYEDYSIRTPGKVTGSVAYIFEKYGLVNLDVGYTDWSNLKFRNNDAVFQEENAFISDALGSSLTYKIGGEIRLSAWSIRGGYRFTESPYENGETIGDLRGQSFGIGYNFGRTKLGLAYDRATQERSQQLYSTGLTSAAAIDNTSRTIVATLTFGL